MTRKELHFKFRIKLVVDASVILHPQPRSSFEITLLQEIETRDKFKNGAHGQRK